MSAGFTKKTIVTVLILVVVCAMGSYLIADSQYSVRKLREKNIVEILKVIQLDEYKFKHDTGKFLVGVYNTDEVNKIFNINLKVEQYQSFLDGWETGRSTELKFRFYDNDENKFDIIATCSKQGTAFFRDNFSIRVTEKPINLESVPPNPCCVDAGRCPTLSSCIFGK